MELALLEKKLQTAGWAGSTGSISKSLSSAAAIEELSMVYDKLEKRVKLRLLLLLLTVEQRHEDVRLLTSMLSLLNKAMKDEKWVALVAGLIHSRISGHLSTSIGKQTPSRSTRFALIDDVADIIVKQLTCDEKEGSDMEPTTINSEGHFEPTELRYLLDEQQPGQQARDHICNASLLFTYIGERPDFLSRKGEKKNEEKFGE